MTTGKLRVTKSAMRETAAIAYGITTAGRKFGIEFHRGEFWVRLLEDCTGVVVVSGKHGTIEYIHTDIERIYNDLYKAMEMLQVEIVD